MSPAFTQTSTLKRHALPQNFKTGVVILPKKSIAKEWYPYKVIALINSVKGYEIPTSVVWDLDDYSSG